MDNFVETPQKAVRSAAFEEFVRSLADLDSVREVQIFLLRLRYYTNHDVRDVLGAFPTSLESEHVEHALEECMRSGACCGRVKPRPPRRGGERRPVSQVPSA